jgi:enamine deaminase RidA (YjgF/YER057c/UK114 family)
MPKKEIVQVDLATSNPNLSPATRFGNLVFVAGQTGRHPTTGEIGKDIREQTRNVLERIGILQAAGTSPTTCSRSPPPRNARTWRAQ